MEDSPIYGHGCYQKTCPFNPPDALVDHRSTHGRGGSDKKKLECGSFRPCVEELRYYGHHVMVKKFKKIGFTEDVITRDKTEYSSHALAEVVDGKTGMRES